MHIGFVGTGNMGLGLDLATRFAAAAAMGRKAWRLHGRAREAGLGRLDSSGLLGLLEPPAGASPP